MMKRIYKDLIVMGPAEDLGRMPGVTNPVEHDDTFELFDGQITVKCYGHLNGHVMYYLEAKGCEDGVVHQSKMVTKYVRCD